MYGSIFCNSCEVHFRFLFLCLEYLLSGRPQFVRLCTEVRDNIGWWNVQSFICWKIKHIAFFSVWGTLLHTDLIKYMSVLFQRSQDERTRDHRLFRLVIPFLNTEARQHFFNANHIRLWNSLPPEVVKSASLVSIKSLLLTFVTHLWSPHSTSRSKGSC